jgi:uncharacterized membrane protein YozB (DUF420 family)
MAPTVDRRAPTSFFFAAHWALLIIVLFGFAPTFYLSALFKQHPLPGFLIIHGSVLTFWFILTAVQASLIRARRVRWHRRVGYAAASWAVLVVAMGLIADAQMASRINSPQDSDIIVVWGNLFSLILFSAFVTLALVFRKTPESHKRLILLASITIIGPATARFSAWPIFPGGMAARPLYGIGGLLLLYGSLIAYDVIVRRRPHPASWIGALAMIVSLVVAVFLAISGKGYEILHPGPSS